MSQVDVRTTGRYARSDHAERKAALERLGGRISGDGCVAASLRFPVQPGAAGLVDRQAMLPDREDVRVAF